MSGPLVLSSTSCSVVKFAACGEDSEGNNSGAIDELKDLIKFLTEEVQELKKEKCQQNKPRVTDGGHQENIAPAGFASDAWFATVHTPISIQEALKIPEAREAQG